MEMRTDLRTLTTNVKGARTRKFLPLANKKLVGVADSKFRAALRFRAALGGYFFKR